VTHAAAAIEALVSGAIDITHAGSIPLMQARERGLPIWNVADGVGDVVGIAVRADSPIKSAADLKGKTLAFPGKGSVPYALIELALEGTGVQVSDLTLVVARFPEMPLILERKAVDGFAGTEPFISMLASNGKARILLRTSDKLKLKEGTFIGGTLGVSEEFARKYPEALKAFLHEFQETSRYIKQNPKPAADIFEKIYPGVVTQSSFTYALSHGLVYFHDIRPTHEDWVKMIEFTNKSGLSKIADPKKFLDGYLHPEFVKP
jgi:NitT/TauT family transport system substrate-binding protein/sulfonate transport system substrate-binding protein